MEQSTILPEPRNRVPGSVTKLAQTMPMNARTTGQLALRSLVCLPPQSTLHRKVASVTQTLSRWEHGGLRREHQPLPGACSRSQRHASCVSPEHGTKHD